MDTIGGQGSATKLHVVLHCAEGQVSALVVEFAQRYDAGTFISSVTAVKSLLGVGYGSPVSYGEEYVLVKSHEQGRLDAKALADWCNNGFITCPISSPY